MYNRILAMLLALVRNSLVTRSRSDFITFNSAAQLFKAALYPEEHKYLYYVQEKIILNSTKSETFCDFDCL